VGGGVGLFSVGCAAAGFKRVVLIDDFRDEINRIAGDSILDLHRKRGIEVLSRDVVAQGLGAEGPFDAVTSFDSMEHWHHSPKRLFRQIMDALRPGGLFVLGVPNCVNLRKRLTVPLGRGKWSRMADWYEPEVFRGHVREPDVDDLRYIGRDLGLENSRILGRNWLGLLSSNPLMRIATIAADRPLRLFPSLCSDIYLVGKKPAR
jgi:SAM-dependent methyltransferase